MVYITVSARIVVFYFTLIEIESENHHEFYEDNQDVDAFSGQDIQFKAVDPESPLLRPQQTIVRNENQQNTKREQVLVDEFERPLKTSCSVADTDRLDSLERSLDTYHLSERNNEKEVVSLPLENNFGPEGPTSVSGSRRLTTGRPGDGDVVSVEATRLENANVRDRSRGNPASS